MKIEFIGELAEEESENYSYDDDSEDGEDGEECYYNYDEDGEFPWLNDG